MFRLSRKTGVKSGVLYSEECAVKPVRKRTGEIINYVGVKHDMTEKLGVESLENVFKSFYTAKKNGTGLGLMIVKKMLTNLLGLIDIGSRHEGTIVTIAIPEGANEEK